VAMNVKTVPGKYPSLSKLLSLTIPPEDSSRRVERAVANNRRLCHHVQRVVKRAYKPR